MPYSIDCAVMKCIRTVFYLVRSSPSFMVWRLCKESMLLLKFLSLSDMHQGKLVVLLARPGSSFHSLSWLLSIVFVTKTPFRRCIKLPTVVKG